MVPSDFDVENRRQRNVVGYEKLGEVEIESQQRGRIYM
jgi:hypothetical protein